MNIIEKIFGSNPVKIIFHYTQPDISKREISTRHGNGGIDGGHTVTHKDGLYNQNLTVGELSLLRTMIWEYKELCKDSHEYRRFLNFIHTWMFTDEKKPVIHADILKDFEEGVNFEERRYGS